MTTYTTKIAKNGSVRYYDAQTGKAIAKKTALENERNFIRTNGTTKERYELAKETYRVDSNGKIEKFGWHQELRRDSSGFYHVEVRGWYNHCGTTDYDFTNDMQEEFGLTIDEFKAEANAEAQAEEKIEETAAEEIVEVEANTEVKAEETESGIGDIFKAAVKTLGEEVSESDAKFEIGKTYFVMHFLTHQTDTITVEARTAQMLTGTTNEGTRKFRIFENVRGEFVKVGKDEEDGNDIYIYAKNEFTPANVEAGKKAAIETAAKLGINPGNESTTEETAEVGEKIDAPEAEAEKFIATQITFPNGYEGEPTIEVSQTFDTLDEAARFIADDYPLIRDENDNIRTAYDGNFFGGIYWAGWKIATADGKILCEVDHLGNTHGDEDIDNLVCKYINENDDFIIPDVPAFLDPESQDDYKEFRPKVEIVKAVFKNSEALDVKEILTPLADQAQVELGNITLADNDDKTCTVNIEVKGSTNGIEKFKALLDGRHPEPPTNSKKFIKAVLDTEPERNQQVATARKEAAAMTKQYALAKVEIKFEESESGAKLWFENTHLLDGYNTDDISWRRTTKAKANETLAQFGLTINDYAAEYERDLQEIRERNRKAFEERSRNHKPRPARVNRFAPKHDDKPGTESKHDDFTAELAKLTAEQSDAKKILDEKEAELVKAQDAHQTARDAWIETNYAIDRLYRKNAEELADKLLPLRRNIIEVKTPEGFSPIIATDTIQIWKNIEKGKFTIHGDCSEQPFFTLAEYDTPAQVEAAINALKAADALGADKFTFPTIEELNDLPTTIKAEPVALTPNMIKAADVAKLLEGYNLEFIYADNSKKTRLNGKPLYHGLVLRYSDDPTGDEYVEDTVRLVEFFTDDTSYILEKVEVYIHSLRAKTFYFVAPPTVKAKPLKEMIA